MFEHYTADEKERARPFLNRSFKSLNDLQRALRLPVRLDIVRDFVGKTHNDFHVNQRLHRVGEARIDHTANEELERVVLWIPRALTETGRFDIVVAEGYAARSVVFANEDNEELRRLMAGLEYKVTTLDVSAATEDPVFVEPQFVFKDMDKEVGAADLLMTMWYSGFAEMHFITKAEVPERFVVSDNDLLTVVIFYRAGLTPKAEEEFSWEYRGVDATVLAIGMAIKNKLITQGFTVEAAYRPIGAVEQTDGMRARVPLWMVPDVKSVFSEWGLEEIWVVDPFGKGSDKA